MNIYQFRFPENEFPGLHVCEEFGEIDFHDAVRLVDSDSQERGFAAVSCVIVVILPRRWLRRLRERLGPLGYEIGVMEKLPDNHCRVQFNRVENISLRNPEE